MSEDVYSVAGVPAKTAILNGYDTADAATLITIPAGKTWYGHIALSGCLNAGLSTVVAQATVTVEAASGTPIPAAGTVLAGLALSAPALLGVAAGVSSSERIDDITVYAPATATATLVLHKDNMSAISATVTGSVVN